MAVEDYKKAIECNPDNAALYFNMGMAFFKQNDKRNACERFHKACSMGNNNACKMIILECSGK
jgi:Tfp pilus assembly protein PilF